MSAPENIKPERILLENHPELNEKWIHERIAEKPSILGLGDVILKDRKRSFLCPGRLDLLVDEPELNMRHEVEIQLGRTDEAHLIRTIEYWDFERKRSPQYNHVAILVAEDITRRILNVVGLLRGAIPIIAMQMRAFRVEDKVALGFSTVDVPMDANDMAAPPWMSDHSTE